MGDNLERRRSETRGPIILGLSISFTALAAISVVLRIYTRRVILRTIGAEDVAIVVAQILSIGVTVLWGLGRHTEVAPLEHAMKAMRTQYAILLIYHAAQTITKISFLIQYRRLFPTGRVNTICRICLILLVIWGIAQQFIVAFACGALEFVAPRFTGHCIDVFAMFNLTACMNILTDFMIFLLPIVPILSLKMPIQRKLILLALFSLGLFACIISIIRLYILHKHHNNSDPSWESSAAAYWSTIELNLGILCASLPTLRPLLKKYMPAIMGTSHPSGSAVFSGAVGYSNAPHRLCTFPRGNGTDRESKVYMQKGAEFHSTTELNSEGARVDKGSLDAVSTGSAEANGLK